MTLSASPQADDAIQSFKLAEFHKGVDGVWALSSRYVPPTVTVADSPFFAKVVSRSKALVTTFHQTLVGEIQDSYLGGEALFAAKVCLKGVYTLQAFLANLGGDVQTHPYELFRALQSFYIDVCIFRECEPKNLDRQYAHENLSQVFQGGVDDLEEQVLLRKSRSPYAPFEPNDGMTTCVIPEEAKRSKDLYWLLQKKTVGQKVDLRGFKLASSGRINLVHQLSLGGIPLRRIDNPPFHHTFGAEVEFYKLIIGEEWDHAVREGQIAYFEDEAVSGLRAFLYWRQDD